jgi:hypothetical protein
VASVTCGPSGGKDRLPTASGIRDFDGIVEAMSGDRTPRMKCVTSSKFRDPAPSMTGKDVVPKQTGWPAYVHDIDEHAIEDTLGRVELSSNRGRPEAPCVVSTWANVRLTIIGPDET